jgi:hypothetical protein
MTIYQITKQHIEQDNEGCSECVEKEKGLRFARKASGKLIAREANEIQQKEGRQAE